MLVLRIFSATFFFTIRPHLDHSHNQKPQHARNQNSHLAPLANVGILPLLGVFQAIRPKKAQNGKGANGRLFQTLSDKISQLFSPLTSLAHWGCFVEF